MIMKTKFFACVAMLMVALSVQGQRQTCIDTDWQFFYGDGSKVLTDPGVAKSWRTLTLPHDWSVETEAAAKAGGEVVGPFSKNSVGGYQTGFTVGGEGWYLKTLNVSAQDLAGQVMLYFEGVYNHAWVYVNGELCHHNIYGYSSFRTNVTGKLHVGENQVAVKVQNLGNNTRWYAGSGIYRHVWLLRIGSMHVGEWDTYVCATENSRINVSTRIFNESKAKQKGSMEVSILDKNGNQVASKSLDFGSMKPGTSQDISLGLTVDHPHTWSLESPYLYRTVISLKDKKGRVTDVLTKRFGFRTLSFSASEGFLLNGKNTLLRGGCVHHDNGLLGAAAFDKAELRKLSILKAQGFNAVRCSHNLPSENFLDVCDSLGLMVVDECFDQWLLAKNADDYHNYFADHSDEDVALMVRRDRNHPSVIMWSIGNEIPGRIEPAGQEAAARLRAGVLKYDSTRPVTAAICGWDQGDAWNSAGGKWELQSGNAFKSLDVGGYNYLFQLYEQDHADNPTRVICGLESFPKLASENWTMVERHPYVIGDFVWTAIDYLGEAGIGAAYTDRKPPMFQPWPWFNGYCGDIDLIGQKKPQSYYRDVVWRLSPVTMAVQPTASQNNMWGWQLEEQSWTWPGHEGQEVTVNVYSRADKVRLELNGEKVAEKVPGNTFWAGFSVPYQPGVLRAVNLDAEGNELPGQEFVLATTGKPVGLRCVYENPVISAATNDLAFVIIELVDSMGRVVTSDFTTQISIRNAGAGELIACGTASPDDMRSFRSSKPTLFRGRALAIVRSNGVAGKVKIEAEIK